MKSNSFFFFYLDSLFLYYIYSIIYFRFYSLQKENPHAEWSLPDDQIFSAVCPNEVVVAGVYLRLFVANPGWTIRRPKDFLIELMDTCLSLMSKEKTDVSQQNIMDKTTNTTTT